MGRNGDRVQVLPGPAAREDRAAALQSTFSVQANAIMRKNFVFQKRSWANNLCLLLTPVVLCALLGILQALINILLNGDSFKCGCKCIEFSATDPTNCLARDKNVCGLQYSDVDQAVYCPITSPAEWPALLQVPLPEYRAEAPGLPVGCQASGSCPLAVPFTGGNPSLAYDLSAHLFEPSPAPLSLSDVTTALASQYPGTAAPSSGTLQYELAFQNRYALYFLENTTCPANVTQLLALGQAGAAPIYSSFGISNPQNWTCSPAVPLWNRDAATINEQLFGGYRGGNSQRTISEYTAAYDWRNTSTANFVVGIHYNSTFQNNTSGAPPAIMRIARQINLAAQAFLRWQRPGASLPLLFVKDMPKPGTRLRLDFSSLLGPLFYMWVWQMLYPVLLASLVYEKEKNLRTMMRMHGLTDLPYWAVMYTWFLALSVAYMIIFMVVGSAIQLNFFLLNDYGIQIIFYFVFLNNQVAWTFLTATIFSNTKTATVCGYLYVFGSGLLGQFLLRFFLEDATFSGSGIFFLEWIPCFALYRGLYEFAQAAFIGNYQDENGMTWSNLSDSQNGLVTALLILLVEWAVFLLLGFYLDQVVGSGSGVKKPWLFFLGKRGAPAPKEAGRRASAEVGVDMERPDVAAERAAVAQLKDGTGDNVIVCKNLNKVFPSRDGNPPKVAVKSLALAVPRGECFGMLGPNGAGKTTSINMMVGFLQPSAGTALIEGLDIRTDMTKIYSVMGVCPQHDLLWESLSGREHLLFYGRLKNLRGAALQAAVERSLRSVNLYAGGVGDKRAGQYSGGMKRRLSVAISLIGDPLVVYMDEPSTGLDPASRNNLWQVVKDAKKDRAIILTTHSMEEAEVLCDRLGIFVDGQFQCIGNPKELTSRYGGSYVFSVTTAPQEMAAVGDLVQSLSPGARRVYAVSGTQRFELPTAEVDLAQVFAAVEQAKGRLQIQAWGIANTTLEDVFVKISKEAQLGERTLS